MIEDAEVVALLSDQRIGQQLELLGVGNHHRAPILGDQFGAAVVDVLGAGLGRSHGDEQFHGDALHDEAARRLVDQAVEIGQSHGRDDAAGETCPFDEQRLCPAPRGREGSGNAGAAAATNQHVGGNCFHCL